MTKKIQNKKIKLGILVFMLFISVSMFLYSIIISNYNIDVQTTLINKLKKEKIHDLTIVKTNTNNLADNVFTEKEKQYIKDNISSKAKENYRIIEYNVELKIPLANEKENKKIYYNTSLSNKFQIIDNWDDYKIIGNSPQKNNEVVISKYIADRIIKDGCFIAPENNQIENLEVYKPKNYKEMITSKKKIYFNDGVSKGTYLIITGIMDEKISKYNILKLFNNSENILIRQKNRELIYDTFYGKQNNIYVNEEIFNKIEVEENNRLDSEYTFISHKINGKYNTPQGFYSYPNSEVEYFDGEKIRKASTLQKNEVIISQPYLKSFTNTKDYNELKEKVRIDCDDKLNVNECILKYIKDNKIIGSVIDIEITDQRLSENSKGKKAFENLKIIGYGVNESRDEYYSKDILKPYIRDTKEVISLSIHEDDFRKIEDIIKKIGIESKYNNDNSEIQYQVLTAFNEYALKRKEELKEISNKLKLVSISIFFITALLLLVYLIKTNKNKKA